MHGGAGPAMGRRPRPPHHPRQGAYLAAAINAKNACDSDPHCAVGAAAREFGIPIAEFRRVIACESNWDPRARNPSSGALGLGQHLPAYWANRARAVGEDPAHWWFPRTNARASAWLWRTSGPGSWVCY